MILKRAIITVGRKILKKNLKRLEKLFSSEP